MNDNILEIKDLAIHFYTEDGDVAAVNGIDLALRHGDTLGLVGETGAGKTTTAKGILRLIPSPPGKIVSGKVLFDGENLLEKTEKEMQKIRGGKISMIFQDPMTALNPVLRVDDQIAEVIRLHSSCSKSEALNGSAGNVGEGGDSSLTGADYPTSSPADEAAGWSSPWFLACNPKLLLAVKPTTA